MRKQSLATGFVVMLLMAACNQKPIQGDVIALCQAAVNRWNAGEKAANMDIRACEQAASQGDIHSQMNLGYSYVKGVGVKADPERGVKWFVAAAETGDPDAQFNLGLAYVKGLGVEKDLKQASEWFLGAAVQGDTASQYALGLMFALGDGVTKDPVQAYAWFDLAATGGHPDAPKNRDEVEKTMTPDQLKRGKERSAVFRKRIEDQKGSAGQTQSSAAPQEDEGTIRLKL